MNMCKKLVCVSDAKKNYKEILGQKKHTWVLPDLQSCFRGPRSRLYSSHYNSCHLIASLLLHFLVRVLYVSLLNIYVYKYIYLDGISYDSQISFFTNTKDVTIDFLPIPFSPTREHCPNRTQYYRLWPDGCHYSWWCSIVIRCSVTFSTWNCTEKLIESRVPNCRFVSRTTLLRNSKTCAQQNEVRSQWTN